MKRIIVIAASFMACVSASAWDALGHSTVASLAEQNLKPSTRKQVENYLGRSIVFYSSWMDEFREEPAYAFSSSCHCFRTDEQKKYAPVQGKLDAVSLLEQAISVVKDRRNQTDSAVVVNLKFIIHLVGDIHCPSHALIAGKSQGFKVYPYKGETVKKGYHSIWDGDIINRRCENMSPAELARDFNRLSRKEKSAVQSGTALEWAEECAAYCECIYDMAKPDDLLYKTFYNPAWPIVQHQLTLAGYRLAKVLNDCFK